MMVYPALFLCFLYATVQVHSCGMILHTDIVHRASLFYPHVISKHQDALQAGAVFPDWGYSFGNSEAAEGAHWEPFIVQAVNYIREKYGSDPNKWSDHAQKLVAFIYGVASHQISDINWHGLGEKFPRWSTNPGTGFLKTMGGLEFGCGGKLCQLAHTTGDVGGDFVVSAQMDVSWEVFHWYTPVNDIQNIYKLLHKTNFVHKVPKELTMMSAMAAMHVGMRAEKILSENVYPYYAYVSSFLAKNLQDHYIGGINDNVAWTLWKWQLLSKWIESGSILESLSSRKNDTNDEIMQRRHLENYSQDLDILSELIDIHDPKFHSIKTTDNAQYEIAINQAAINQAIESSILSISRKSSVVIGDEPNHSQKCLTHPRECLKQAIKYSVGLRLEISNIVKNWKISSIKPHEIIVGNTMMENFGAAIAIGDWNGDGISDIAVGAPAFSIKNGGHPGYQQGKVYIFYKDSSGKSKSIHSLTGGESNARFGSQLLTLDFNQDGIDDLVIAAPGSNSSYYSGEYIHSNYRGQIFVYFGSKSSGIVNLQNPDIVFETSIFEELGSVGFKLKHFDVNGDGFDDIIVGSPLAYGGTGAPRFGNFHAASLYVHRGMVSVFLSRNSSHLGSNLKFDTADIHIRGESDYELFGYDFELLGISKGESFLFVGSPGHSQSRGKVSTFKISCNSFEACEISRVGSTIEGETANSEFGSSLVQHSAVKSLHRLFVGSPGANCASSAHDPHCGSLSVYLIQESNNASSPSLIQQEIIRGPQPLGRFGDSLTMIDQDRLVVGMPFSHCSGLDSGSVDILRASDLKLLERICPPDSKSRFGQTVVANQNLQTLIVGSPRSGSKDKFQAGRVSIYFLPTE